MSVDVVPFPDESAEKWTPLEITSLMTAPGRLSADDWRLSTFVAVVLAESAGMPRVLGPVIYAPGSRRHYSYAIGMFQLLKVWHVDNEAMPGWARMSEVDCMSPDVAADRAVLLLQQTDVWAYNMLWWTAYRNGAYQRYVGVAMDAQAEYRALAGLPALAR